MTEELIQLKKASIPVKVKKIEEEKEEDYIVIDTEELSKPPTTPPPEEPANPINNKATNEAFANMLGFMCATGLPEEEFSKKQKFYKQQAIDLGLIDNLQLVIKEYMPDTEMSPVMALAISLGIFGFIVYTDRQQTIKEYNAKHGIMPKGKNKKIKTIPDKSKSKQKPKSDKSDNKTNEKTGENNG
jgi:hypothetical protein